MNRMNSFTRSKIYYKAMQTKYGKLFLITLSIFTIIFIGYLVYSHNTFLKSQENVKKCYEEHIKKVDSLYLSILHYNKDVVIGIQKISDATLADSLIKAALTKTRVLSRAQYDNLGVIVESHFKKIESLHEKHGEKISKDSLRLSVEREVLNGQAKAMIDLHLNKIEHEYSNITLWAAVLTILFLVFSFYSVFKADELIQQGTNGLKEIRRIKTQGEQTIEQLNESGKDLLKSTNESIRSFMIRQHRKMLGYNNLFEERKREMDRLYTESLNNLATAQDDFGGQTKELLRKFEDKLEKLRAEQEHKFTLQQDEFNHLVVEINTFFAHLKNQKQQSKSQRFKRGGHNDE